MNEGETRLNEDGTLALDDDGAILHECTCCTCDACDANNRVDGRWPQYYSATVAGLSFCRVTCFDPTLCTFDPATTAAKFTAGTGGQGSPNTTLKTCLRHYGTLSATSRFAVYACAITASCRIGIERYAPSAACATLDGDQTASLVYHLAVQHNFSGVGTIAASPGGASRAANVVTITTTANHGRAIGDCVEIAGVSSVGGTDFNGVFLITAVPSATTFRYAQTAVNDTGGSGTVTVHTILASPRIFAQPLSAAAVYAQIVSGTLCPAWSMYTYPGTGTVFKQTPWLKTFTTSNNQNCFVSPSISWGQGTIAFTPCQLV